MKIELDQGVLTAELGDDLVALNVKEYKMQIEAFLDEKSGQVEEVVLDLSGCENIDSVGVTFIIGVYKQVLDMAMGFRVTGSSDEIKQLFKLMRLDDFFEQ